MGTPGGRGGGVRGGGVADTLPACEIVPPCWRISTVSTILARGEGGTMTMISFALRNVSGSAAAAMARFVIGPMATMVIESGLFSRSRESITSWAGS